MQISNDFIATIEPVPVAPAAQPRPADIGGVDPRSSARDRKRDGAQHGRQRAASFRAALDSATANAVPNALRRDTGSDSAATDRVSRPERIPDHRPHDVEHIEGAELYRQHHPSPDVASVPQSAASDRIQHQFLKASGSYAARFFSVASTFARPGENLEISA
ncbi:MAG: hypothetical protein FJX59_07895 [Alphaproteobacteria bacterium]|nr:hypothetical protein [Alphaproteobacteria bacterium]